MNLTRLIVSTMLMLLPLSGRAALDIEIVGGAAQQIPVAVVPFGGSATAQQDSLSAIIGADLRRSGLFRVLETRGVANQPHEANEVRYADWAAIQAQALAIDYVQG